MRGEPLEREERRELEVRELDAGRLERGTELGDERDHVVVRDREAAGADALREVDQVRRRVEPGPMARGPQDRLQHRGGRALPVRAGDVQRAEPALGMAADRERPRMRSSLRSQPFATSSPWSQAIVSAYAGSVDATAAAPARRAPPACRP